MKVFEKLLSGRFWLAITAAICIVKFTHLVCEFTIGLLESQFESGTQIILMIIPVLSGLIGGVVGFYFQKVRKEQEEK